MSNFDSRAAEWDKDLVRVERANAVAVAIREQVTLSKSMTAFEYGCGTGLLSFALQPYLGSITLADSSTGMLEVLRGKITASGSKNMTPLLLDLITDPLPKARFDLVYTLLTLHHIHDTDRVLQGFHALLKPGGLLCIADLDKEDGSFHFDSDFDGYNGFERGEMNEKIMRTGFANVRFSTCYESPKNGRFYPMFLAVSEKSGNHSTAT
ncbi:MAG: class I SAM-dependent methyltransferase [Chloroflexota bacterium]